MAICRHTRRAGLTLLEVLLVVAIIISLGAIAYPTLSAMYGDVRVKAAADQVQAAWTEARANAIEGGRAYRFSVQPGTGNFRVAPDSPDFWDGGGSGAAEESDLPPHIEEGTLSGGIVFDAPANLPTSGEWTTVAVFNPDGTCQSDTEITLREADDDGAPIVIRVRAMTGAITVRKKSQDR